VSSAAAAPDALVESLTTPQAPEYVATADLSLGSVAVQWPAILAEVQAVNRTASSLLGQATLLDVADGEMMIGFESEPLRDLFVKDPKKGEFLQAAIRKVLGQAVRIKCTVVLKGQSPPTRSAATPRPSAKESRAGVVDQAPGRVVPGEPPAVERGEASSDPTRDPVVREATNRYGAKVGDVQWLSDSEQKEK
jgi:hypothetical protein